MKKRSRKCFFFLFPLEHPLILFISIIVNDNNITDDVGKVGLIDIEEKKKMFEY